ncbi:ankyrin repeat domain-containing protein [Candidatus Bathyarchaeota archaeon]|nr:ankyrin repeat domain-containing protein [Candidatus Bathyarchaeota archaeon]
MLPRPDDHGSAVTPVITVSRPKPGAEDLSSAPAPCPADESARLWKRAYDLLSEENPEIMDDAEAVLKDQADIPQQANMRDRLADVAAAQKKKFQNKQWKVQWLGKPQMVREKIESVVEHANQWSALISVGMAHAPPYVSVPWSAATALLPMMMNEFKEHQGAMDGLESITKLVLSYQLAERVFLGRDGTTRETYASVVMDFYKKILEYQARAIQYFGRSTLKRLGRNVMGSNLWAGMPGVLAGIDDNVRRSLDFISMEDQASGFSSLKDILERQEEKIETLVESALAKTEEVTDIVNWVSGIPIENDHADVRQKLGEGHYTSGRWFLDDPQVTAWMNWDPGCRSLWLRGGMGTGKSSLASILVEELVQSPDGIIAFFYCSRNIDEKAQKPMQRNNVDNVLRSLLAQSAVSTDGGSISDGVKKRYLRDKRRVLSGFALESNDCLMILRELISRQPDTHFTFVVDALDESEDYDTLQTLLHSVSTARNVRFFFSSRLDVKVEDSFMDARAITIDSQNCDDIERFLKVEVSRRRDGCGITDPQVDKLKNILLNRANGMFLWVKIQVNSFLHPIKSKRTRLESDIALRLGALEDFSAVGEELLYAAYDDEYDRATGFGAEPGRLAAVVSALRWVLSAFRPLSLRELAYAVYVNPQDGSPTRGVQEGDLLEFCSNLLVEDSTGIMQLAHLSVRNYLEARKPPDFVSEMAHMEAALTSLYFMRSPSYDELKSKGSGVIQQGSVALTRGFYEYVATYWSSHCRKAPESHAVMETLGLREDAAGDEDNAAGPGPEVAIPDKHIVSDLFERITNTPEWGDPELADFIAERIACNTDLSPLDKFGDTILHHIAKLHEEICMELLLRADAPLNAQNNVGNTALHVAAIYGFEKGARQLLVAGADRNTRNNRGETALHLALVHESAAVFETLLSAGVDVLAQDHWRNTPFHYAAQWESFDAVKSLLEEGYSPDGVNEAGDTALSIAIRSSNKDMVQELIRHGAMARSEDMAAASSRGLEELVTASLELQPRLDPALPSTAGFKVEISEGPSTCQYCNVGRWLSSRRGIPHPHWPSLDDLLASVATCSLCAFFEKEISHQNPETMGSTAGRLLVTVELASDRPWEKSGKDTLTLSVGKTTTLTWEICFDTCKWSIQYFPAFSY